MSNEVNDDCMASYAFTEVALPLRILPAMSTKCSRDLRYVGSVLQEALALESEAQVESP